MGIIVFKTIKETGGTNSKYGICATTVNPSNGVP